MTWFQIWTVCWQVAVFLTPLLLGVAVLWLKSQFVTKVDAVVERNRVDARMDTMTAAAKAEVVRLDGELKAAEKERDRRWEVVREKQADHEGRLTAAEKDIAKPPSRHQLNNTIATLQATVHGLSRTIDTMRQQVESQHADIRREVGTLNGYLHTMIEKHLS